VSEDQVPATPAVKIAKDVVGKLIVAVQKEAEPLTVDAEGEALLAYYLDDLSVTFTPGEKPVFYGLIFEALGQEFSVLGNLDVLIAVPSEEVEDETDALVIADESFIAKLEEFLSWRTSMLENFSV